jgi:lipoprotein-anchoring transpeptidase ErfK/SrfK
MSPNPRRSLAAALLAVALAGGAAACSSAPAARPARSPAASSTQAHAQPPPASSTAPTTATKPPAVQSRPAPAAHTQRRAAADASPVHLSLQWADGKTFGVGVPLIAHFSRRFTDASALQAATSVTVDGRPVSGGSWYFVASSTPGYPVEGHYRLKTYWPAHAHIVVTIAAQGLWAGPGLGFANSLFLDFHTGAAQTMVVDGRAHTLTLTVDGRRRAVYPVSLGQQGRATYSGIKVVMAHEDKVDMRGPGYFTPGVPWTERLTWSGEYLHSASWNVYNIEHGIDSSHGCTNLRPDDAKALYDELRVGDVVDFVNIQEQTTPMPMSDGWADWNLPWSTWVHGGSIPTGA